jgi:branched-chain amino acid aminotransferase
MSDNLNRAFMYGESVFTTLRMIDGKLTDWDHHFERLKLGTEFVYGPFSDVEDWREMLRTRLEDLLFNETGDQIIRVTIYLEQLRGLKRSALTTINELKIQLSFTHYDSTHYEGKMYKWRTAPALLRPNWWPGFLKSGNYLETILAQKKFLQSGDDDLLFLAPNDTILESSVCNVFVVRHKKIYTPPVGPNVLDGVMRRKIIEASGKLFAGCDESASTIAQLYKADAVIGANSVRGPFLVDRIDDHEILYNQEILNVFELLKKQVYG